MLATVILTVTLNPSLDKTYSVPGFAVGRDLVAARVELSPGGKGLNVASFARALGAEVTATGILAGHTGRHVEELLAGRGIAGDFVWVPGETRSCHIIHDPESGTLSQIKEPGPAVPPGTQAAVAAKVHALAGRARVVVFSGSLPPGMDAGIYRALAAAVRARGVHAVLDAAGEPLALGLAARPDVIKPNLEELDDLAVWLRLPAGPCPAGGATDPEAVRRWAAAAGGEIRARFRTDVVASLGPLGAVVVAAEGAHALVPPPIEAVNTISCGDAVVAAIALGLARGQGLLESARLGVAMATAKAGRFATGLVDPEDAARVLPHVRIERLVDP